MMYRMKWITWTLLWISMVIWLSGCGRNLPVLNAAQLQNKLSVLVITGADLQAPAKTAFQTNLANWLNEKHITYEWFENTDSLNEEQQNKMNQRPYDYILVVGNKPVSNILPQTKQLPDHKWILLNDTLSVPAGAIADSNVALKEIPVDSIHQEWDMWVKQQLVSGRSIEWLTNSANPIPSDWAPSEEAETISLTDANGWFPQFQTQVRQHGPSWIVLYAPLDPSYLQRVKNLQVPIMNIAASSVQLDWNTVLTSIQQVMETKTWKPGVQPYTESEYRILKNS